MTAVSELTSSQQAELYNQVGDAMYNPGFNYDAHVAANTSSGVFTPPVYVPPTSSPPSGGTSSGTSDASSGGSTTSSITDADSTNSTTTFPGMASSIPLPPVGSPEYQGLLLETGRADLNGFNYAAHLEAKKGRELSNFDAYLNAASGSELVAKLGTVDVNSLVTQASSEQIQELVKKFAGDAAFAAYLENKISESPQNVSIAGIPMSTTSITYQSRQGVPLPEFGSPAYQALLLETGLSDLVHFDYAAHLDAKKHYSLANFDTYFNAADGTALLSMLKEVNVNELMSKASPEQVQQLIAKFSADQAFKTYLDQTTTPTLPAEGSAQYQALLQQTGRTSLTNFDYQAHLKVMTEAFNVVQKSGLTAITEDAATKVGTEGKDVIRATDKSDAFLVGGGGADVIIGAAGNDVLMGGIGSDQMRGGLGDDVYYLDSLKDKITEKPKQGDDTIIAAVDIRLPKYVENLILLEGDLNATGNAAGNTLVGSAGDNSLDGGVGMDSLTGGDGVDIFIFASKLGTNNVDTVTDFADDTLALNKKVFTALKSGLTEENFVVGKSAVESDDFLIYDTGTLYYDPDGNGAKIAIPFAILTGAPTLSVEEMTIV